MERPYPTLFGLDISRSEPNSLLPINHAELRMSALAVRCRTMQEWKNNEAWQVNHQLMQHTLVGFSPGVDDNGRRILADSIRRVTSGSQDSGLHKAGGAKWLNRWDRYTEVLDPMDQTAERYSRTLLPIRSLLQTPLKTEELSSAIRRIRTWVNAPDTATNQEEKARNVEQRLYCRQYLPLLERRYQVLLKKQVYSQPHRRHESIDSLRQLETVITKNPGHTIGEYLPAFQRQTKQTLTKPRFSVVSLAQMGVIRLSILDEEIDTWQLEPVELPAVESTNDLVAMEEYR